VNAPQSPTLFARTRHTAVLSYGKVVVVGLLLVAGLSRGADPGTGFLVLRVEPEAKVVPSQFALNFTIPADGSPVEPATATISVWVRALRGQTILVSAKPQSELRGDTTVIPISSVQWASTAVHAASGAETASGNGGYLDSGSVSQLVTGWQTAGMLTLRMSFSLLQPNRFPPGFYSAAVIFQVKAR
jgi:hypothetical protein